MDSKSFPVSLMELFYYLFFALLLFAKGIGLYDGQPLFKLFLVAALLCYGLKMLLTPYTTRELLLVTGLLLLGGIVYITSGEKGALLYIMMVTGLKNVPLKRVFKVGLAAWLLSFGGLFILTALHLIESPFKVHDKFGLGYVIRWGLGYAHPNVLHISFLVLVMLICYLGRQRMGWKSCLLLMLGNLYVFLYSLSNTGLIAVTFLLGLCLYWHYRQQLSPVEKVLIQICLPIFLGMSLAAPLILTGPAFDLLNKVMNTRLALAKYFLTTQPLSLFGTRIADIITYQITMDNSYVFACVAYGAVSFIIIAGAYWVMIRRFCKRQMGPELSIILASLLAGVTEPFLWNTSFKNISMLFLAELIFSGAASGKLIGIRRGSYGEKVILLPDPSVWGQNIKERLRRHRGRFLLTLAAGTLAGGLGYGMLAVKPEAIIVPRENCDAIEQKAVYLEPDILMDEKVQVLGYRDSETEMIVLRDNIILLEWMRGLVTAGLLTGTVLASLGLVLPASKRSES